MPTNKDNSGKYLINEQISFIEEKSSPKDLLTTINQQIRQTNISNTNMVQLINPGIYLLTLGKPHINDPLRIKRLNDRVQYSLLPRKSAGVYLKITMAQLRNHGHAISPSLATYAHNFLKERASCQLIFYYQLDHLEQILLDRLLYTDIRVHEVLTNRVVILTDGNYAYPLSLSRLVARAIWQNISLSNILDIELLAIAHKLSIMPELFIALKSRYPENRWARNGTKIEVEDQGVTKAFDYASLLDDIIFARYDKRPIDYLSFFRLSDLDTTSSFPTVAVRSPVHLKARPKSLVRVDNGYAIAAATEGNGKQTPVTVSNKKAESFSLWMQRALRHLFRHNYRARVVTLPEEKHFAFSLVGEQVATIALFPALVKGVFETLNLETPESVRLIAHNEDVLTIAHDTASWVDINAVNRRATSLFRFVANDGADPLSLFEQVLLPNVGVGTFSLRTVPNEFFELIDAAETTQISMAKGHEHYLLGLAYQCLHEWGLAVSELKKAVRFDTNDPEILHALGSALMEIGQIKESLPFLKRAFDLMPENPEIANDCGISAMECGSIADAILAFERAVRLNPGSADYLKNLGNGYLLAARPLDAMLELKKAIKCDPYSADAHASLAHIYLATGDEAKAKRHALLAYSQNPIDKNIANMLWLLTLGKK